MTFWSVCSAIVATVGGCASPASTSGGPDQPAYGALDDLSVGEQRLFQGGRREFMEIEGVSEGLGPLFNGSSCAQCHNLPGVGGGGISTVLRAGCLDASGAFHEPAGGTLIPLFSTRPDIGSATVPSGCMLLERRRTTSVLGAGLIEAIPDQAIVAQAAAPHADGVRGRVAWVDEENARRVGRFGWKAQHASLRVFAADAYRNEMGVTNVLADFMRYLAPPVPGQDAIADDAQARLFQATGCGDCHRPSYVTGMNVSAALSEKEVPLYSDLLLHDVGTGSVIPQGAARAVELRTPPLWGVGIQPVLLHDGRASSLDEAIRAHAGEAAVARQAYERLSPDDQTRLLQFLRSL